uniref:Uncharacterized protein n=1 Tax=Geospiza parvula TaxID=87175 RepID=A0A8U8B3V8_GEOPR
MPCILQFNPIFLKDCSFKWLHMLAGISHTGPLLFLFLALICCLFPFGMPAKWCHKCYRKHHMERNQSSSFITHTYVNSHVINPSKLRTCRQNREKYWITRNLGKRGNRFGIECPKGERWICFTFNLKDTVQDLVKKQIVNKKVKTAQQFNSVLTPNYLLSHITRLQAVTEMVANKAVQALELISSQ